MEKEVTLKINRLKALKIANDILDMFEGGYNVEDCSTILNGVVMALSELSSQFTKYATQNGMVEQMVLSWLECADKVYKTQYSKYICLESEEPKPSGKITI